MYNPSELDNYKLQVEYLHEKLKRSEEHRQQLEKELEKILQKRNEHDKFVKMKAREKYKEFVNEQNNRIERNKMLLKMLNRIDQQTAAMSARSEKLKMMKMQYEMYFAKLVQSQTLRCIQNSTTVAKLTTAPHQIPVLVPTANIPMGMDNTRSTVAANVMPTTNSSSYQVDDALMQKPTTEPVTDAAAYCLTQNLGSYQNNGAAFENALNPRHWTFAMATPAAAAAAGGGGGGGGVGMFLTSTKATSNNSYDYTQLMPTNAASNRHIFEQHSQHSTRSPIDFDVNVNMCDISHNKNIDFTRNSSNSNNNSNSNCNNNSTNNNNNNSNNNNINSHNDNDEKNQTDCIIDNNVEAKTITINDVLKPKTKEYQGLQFSSQQHHRNVDSLSAMPNTSMPDTPLAAQSLTPSLAQTESAAATLTSDKLPNTKATENKDGKESKEEDVITTTSDFKNINNDSPSLHLNQNLHTFTKYEIQPTPESIHNLQFQSNSQLTKLSDTWQQNDEDTWHYNNTNGLSNVMPNAAVSVEDTMSTFKNLSLNAKEAAIKPNALPDQTDPVFNRTETDANISLSETNKTMPNNSKISIENIENAIYGELVNPPTNKLTNTLEASGLMNNLVTQPELQETLSIPPLQGGNETNNIEYANQPAAEIELATNTTPTDGHSAPSGEPAMENAALIPQEPQTPAYNTEFGFNDYKQYGTHPDSEQMPPEDVNYGNVDYSNYDMSQYSNAYDQNAYPGYIYDEATGQYVADPRQGYMNESDYLAESKSQLMYQEDQNFMPEQQNEQQQEQYNYDYGAYMAQQETPANAVLETDMSTVQSNISAAVESTTAAEIPEQLQPTAQNEIENQNQNVTIPAESNATLAETLKDAPVSQSAVLSTDSNVSNETKPTSILSSTTDSQKKKKRVNFVDVSETDENATIQTAASLEDSSKSAPQVTPGKLKSSPSTESNTNLSASADPKNTATKPASKK